MVAYRLILEDSGILSVLKGKISFQLTYMFGLLQSGVFLGVTYTGTD